MCRCLSPILKASNARSGAVEGKKPFTLGAYCLGKIVWGKGWEEFIALLGQHSEARSQVVSVPLDIYGTGEAATEVCRLLHTLLPVKQATCSNSCLFKKLPFLTVHEVAACESGVGHAMCCCLCQTLLEPAHLLEQFRSLLSGCITPVTVRHLCTAVETM